MANYTVVGNYSIDGDIELDHEYLETESLREARRFARMHAESEENVRIIDTDSRAVIESVE